MIGARRNWDIPSIESGTDRGTLVFGEIRQYLRAAEADESSDFHAADNLPFSPRIDRPERDLQFASEFLPSEPVRR